MTDPELKIEPAALWKAIENSTQPTGQDYFYGGVRPDDPSVAAYQRRIQEIDRFHTWYDGLPRFSESVRTKEDMFDAMGRWLDSAVGAAPNINDEQTGKYWRGCRKYAQMPVGELVTVVRRLYDFKTRYEVMLDLQGNWIKTFEKKIGEAIFKSPHPGFDERGWTKTLTFWGTVCGGVGGFVIGGGVGYVIGQKVAALAVGLGVLGAGGGGLGGWAVGSVSDSTARANYLARLNGDMVQFRTLRQTHRHLMDEGVHHKTLARMVDIMQQYDADLRLKPDADRKAFIERTARRRLEDALTRNNKSWDDLTAHIVQAVRSNDPQAFGRAFVAVAEAGNILREASKQSADTRASSLLDGHGEGMPPDPLKDPEALWF